jgi:hypothetical protein
MRLNQTRNLMTVALLATTLLVTACAKAPESELTAAQSALDQARTAEAEKYAPDTWRAANDSLAAANAEIQAQNSKFALFRKYDRAKNLIAASQSSATQAQADAGVNKQAARTAADEALTMATAAVDSAKTALDSAPMGKDNRADVEAMKADLAGAETNLEQVRQAIAQEDYLGAKAQADAIRDKAMTIVNDVQGARDRMAGRSPGM